MAFLAKQLFGWGNLTKYCQTIPNITLRGNNYIQKTLKLHIVVIGSPTSPSLLDPLQYIANY